MITVRSMRWAGLATRMEDVERTRILVGKRETKVLAEVEMARYEHDIKTILKNLVHSAAD